MKGVFFSKNLKRAMSSTKTKKKFEVFKDSEGMDHVRVTTTITTSRLDMMNRHMELEREKRTIARNRRRSELEKAMLEEEMERKDRERRERDQLERKRDELTRQREIDRKKRLKEIEDEEERKRKSLELEQLRRAQESCVSSDNFVRLLARKPL